ncbi:MAG: hypothetical protein JO323_26155 [Acidobacteriia bacterium]|nr:hypothetical protein [Terriglobia bacterium]
MKHVLAAVACAGLALAQGPPQGPPQPPRSAKAAAPVDLTGYWVSVISEDWRWRMVTPLKGDFANIPVNAEARKVGEMWDPAKDEAAGLACKSYGAPGIMRVPGRVHITWQDENTLQIETDSGQQTRTFHFAGKAPERVEPSWQGYSAANWERPPNGVELADPFPVFAVRTGTKGRSLEVVTTNLRPGYLRKNGIPYSAAAKVNEFYDYHKEANGDEWFTVTTIVTDPQYLTGPWITSSDYKKERDNSRWHPEPCSSK